MSNDTLKLTDQKVLEHARQSLREHLPLQAQGYTCSTDDLLNVLLGVAVNRGTIQSLCADLVGSPDPQTIRGYFNEQLYVEDLPHLAHRFNAALAAQIPPRIRRHPRDLAIDFQDRPYYGKLPQAQGQWVRGQARDGTTRFYRVATAYVMLKGLRLTLAIQFVLPDQDTRSVLDELLKQVKNLGIGVARLFLDKGFARISVLEHLSHCAQPALIACPIRGKRGGTRALCQGNQSYRTLHTFKGAAQSTFTAQLAVCRVFTSAKRTKRLKRRGEWMVFILIHLDLTPQQTRRLYRKRFGIESSYRCAGQVRGWTTSKNPAYRFVLIAVGFFLLNVWVHLRWLFTQVPRRGGRWLDTKCFQLARLAKFIIRALERHYGCVQEIDVLASPRP